MQGMRTRPVDGRNWTLAEVAEMIGVHRVEGDARIGGLTLASSLVEPGDLFAALPGSKAHGARFIPQALAAGATAVLTDAEGAVAIPDGVAHLVVESPRQHIAELAVALHGRPSASFLTVGITGTQGKTTTAHLAEAAVGSQRSAIIGTNGTRICGIPAASALTTPEAPELQSLFAVMREESVEVCVMEVSSHSLVQGRVDGFVFDVAVFLNLGRDHLDFHHDMDDYFAAKAQLFTPEHARKAVINIDDEYGRRLAATTELPVHTYSLEGREADWRGTEVRTDASGGRVMLHGTDGTSRELRVPLPGLFNVSNAVAAHLALLACGFDADALVEGLASSPGVPGRMERIDAGDASVIVDYAHKPEAITAVLTALRPATEGRLIIVLGAGGDRDRGKRPLMGAAAAELADLVVVTDDNPRTEDPSAIRADLLAGVAGRAEVVEIGDRRAAIAHALVGARSGDTILIAGKGHERGQETHGVIHPFDDREVARELLAERP